MMNNQVSDFSEDTMFDSSHIGDSTGMFAPHTSYVVGDTDLFEAPRPRGDFRRQKLGIYLLSNLFAASFMGNSSFVRDKRLVGLARDKAISYTGETFDQWDLDVLLHCAMRTATTQNGIGKINVEPEKLLQDMQLRNFEENRSRVYSSLFRLHTGSLLIEGNGYRYMTRLIDRVLLDQSKGRCLVEVNGDVVNALRCERNLRLTLDRRYDYKRCGLAKWLHGVAMVFKGGFKADVNSLHLLSGSSNRSRYIFPNLLRKALDMMGENGVIDAWQLDGNKLMVFPRDRRRQDSACGFIVSGTL